MKVSEIAEILNNWMPTSIAEDFDNVGLIIGDPKSLINKILITSESTFCFLKIYCINFYQCIFV